MADSSQVMNNSSLGSRWEDAAIAQSIFEQQSTLERSRNAASLQNQHSPQDIFIEDTLSARPPLLQELLRSLPTDTETSVDVIGEPMPLSAPSNSAITATTTALVAPRYPGYLLRYTPGSPLEKRPAVAQWQRPD